MVVITIESRAITLALALFSMTFASAQERMQQVYGPFSEAAVPAETIQPATKNGQQVGQEIQEAKEAPPATVDRPFHVGDSMDIVVAKIGKPYKISKGGKDEAGRKIVVYHYKDYHVGSVVFVDGKVFEGVVRDAKEAAKAAAETVRESSDHLAVALSGWISQTFPASEDVFPSTIWPFILMFNGDGAACLAGAETPFLVFLQAWLALSATPARGSC